MNKDQFQGAAQDVAGKVQQTAGMAVGSSDLRATGFVREVAGKAQHAYGDAREFAGNLRERASDAASEVYDRAQDHLDHAGDFYDRARGELQSRSRSVEARVGDHPLSSLLIAGAAGFIVGLLVKSWR